MKTLPSEKTDVAQLNRHKAYETLKKFSFVEISDILLFLNVMCPAELGISEMAYIRNKIDLCLRRHDNGENYFIPIREFATEIDCLVDSQRF